MLQCSTCGIRIPERASFCPGCGTITSVRSAESGVSPNEPTSIYKPTLKVENRESGISVDSLLSATPSGFDNPYASNPYDQKLVSSSPQPVRRRWGRMFLISGLVVVLLLAGVGWSLFLIRPNMPDSSVQPGPQVTTVSQQASPSVTPEKTAEDIYLDATAGSPVLNDALNTKTGSSWVEYNEPGYSCTFRDGAYHFSIQTRDLFFPCFANTLEFRDFAFQVSMTIIKGTGGGILFRAGTQDPYGYRFHFHQDGYDLVYGDQTLYSRLSGLKANPNQTYLLTAIARGNSIRIYIDKQMIVNVQGDGAVAGKIGFMGVDWAGGTELTFTDAQVWTLA